MAEIAQVRWKRIRYSSRTVRASIWRQIALPVGAVAACQLLRSPLAPLIGPQSSTVQMFSFLAVFVAASVGGFWAGMLASFLSIGAGYLGFVAETGGGLVAE